MKNKSLFLFLCCLFLFSQSNSKDIPELTAWRGGLVTFDVGLGMNMLGLGSGSALGGGVLSPRLHNRSSSIFFNPAELSTLIRPHLVIDPRIGIGTGTFGLDGNSLLSDAELQKQTDAFLKDSSVFLFNKTTGYKSASKVKSGSAGFNGDITSFSLAIPIYQGLVFGFGATTPIDMNVSLRLSDLSIKLRAARETGTQTIGIDILMNMSIAADLVIRSNVMNFGAGYQVFDNETGMLSAGVSARRYDTRTVLNFDMPIDGLISIQKSEYYFNNPSDRAIDFAAEETNKLKWKAYGDYRDTRWGFTVGAYYNGRELRGTTLSALNASLVFDYVPSLTMSDPSARSESYAPVFLVGKPGGKGTDSMQILIDSLKLSKPNLTKPTENVFSTMIQLQQPSSLTFGIDVGLGAHTIAINYVQYFGKLQMNFAEYQIGKDLSSGIKLAADFTMPEQMTGWNWLLLPVRLLYLDIDGMMLQALQAHTGYEKSHYIFGGGVVLGAAIVNGISQETAKSLRSSLGTVLPASFTLGRHYTIFSRYTIGVMVIGFPDMMLKTSVGIEL